MEKLARIGDERKKGVGGKLGVLELGLTPLTLEVNPSTTHSATHCTTYLARRRLRLGRARAYKKLARIGDKREKGGGGVSYRSVVTAIVTLPHTQPLHNLFGGCATARTRSGSYIIDELARIGGARE